MNPVAEVSSDVSIMSLCTVADWSINQQKKNKPIADLCTVMDLYSKYATIIFLWGLNNYLKNKKSEGCFVSMDVL